MSAVGGVYIYAFYAARDRPTCRYEHGQQMMPPFGSRIAYPPFGGRWGAGVGGVGASFRSSFHFSVTTTNLSPLFSSCLLLLSYFLPHFNSSSSSSSWVGYREI